MLEKLKFWTYWNKEPKVCTPQDRTSDTSFKGIFDYTRAKEVIKYAVPEPPKDEPQTNYPSYYYPNINGKKQPPMLKYAVPEITPGKDENPVAPTLKYAVPEINPELVNPEEAPTLKYAVPRIKE